MDAKELINKKIEKIQNVYIKGFTQIAFNKADPAFWICPCSSSGRFHPPKDNGEGGLVRHLIKAVAVTEELARRENFTQYETDLAISATLLHDIKKNGEPWGDKTDYSHGIIGAKYLEQFDLPDHTGKQIILDAVRYHMAPWNTICSVYGCELSSEEQKEEIKEKLRGSRPHSIIEKCVQDADYWASRSSMSFFPGKNIDYD